MEVGAKCKCVENLNTAKNLLDALFKMTHEYLLIMQRCEKLEQKIYSLEGSNAAK